MSDLMAHALDATELARLRTHHPPQRTDIFLAFCPSFDNVDAAFDDTVYTLRVNQVFATNDMIYEVDYDRDGLGAGVAADFAKCLDDMTVFVGTSEGAYDIGVARLRGFAAGSDETSGTMLLGEMSEIAWADNLYLTVIGDFNLWPRHVYIDGAGNVFMDRDVAYTNQHEYPDPVPVLGPDAVVYDADNPINAGNTVDVLFDGSDSWALDGGALTFAWSAPGASATAGMATSTPTITYDAPGRYTVSCIVSRNYPPVRTFTGYRRVLIFDSEHPPTKKFTLENCAGQWDSGGWTFSVRMWDEIKRSEVVDRAKVILFARDWFDNVEVSTGPIESPTHGVIRANVMAVGWIVGESIVLDNEKGWVDFQVQSAHWWLDRMTGFPCGIEDVSHTPTDWFEFDNLTVDAGLWSFLHWRTTATRMMDLYLTGDARQIKEFNGSPETLWQQIVRASEDTILARPCCDRYSRLFVEIPINLMFLADRVGIPIVLDMTRADWREQIDIERRIVPEQAMLDMSGVGYQDGAADPYFSLAYGHIFGRYGGVDRLERLALQRNQANNNILAGLLLAAANNEYPNVDYLMAGNYRVLDICPHQYVRYSIVAGDTERDIVWTNKQFVPTAVSLVYDNDNGVLMVDVSCCGETDGVHAVTGDPPQQPPDLPDPEPPTPPVDPDPVMWDGPIKMAVAYNSKQLGYTADMLRHHVLSVATVGTVGVDLFDTAVSFYDAEVAVGDTVENVTTHAITTVATIVSANHITLTANIGLGVGSDYHISGAQWVDVRGAIDTTPLGANETIIQFLYIRTGNTTVGAWVLTDQNVWYTSDVLTPAPGWTSKLTIAAVRAHDPALNIADFRGMAVRVADTGYLIVNLNDTGNNSGFGSVYTTNTGAAWNYSTFPILGAGWAVTNSAPYYGCEIDEISGIVYVIRGGGTPAGQRLYVFRSADAGANFVMGTNPIANASGWPTRADLYKPYQGGTLFASCRQPIGVFCVFSSGDDGDTWVGITPAGYTTVKGLAGGNEHGKTGLSGWYGNTGDVITIMEDVATIEHMIMRSSDGGASWVVIGDAGNDELAAAGLFQWTPGLFAGSIIVAPTTWDPDEDVLVATGLAQSQIPGGNQCRIYFTLDGGTHWCNKMGNWYSNPAFDNNGDASPEWVGGGGGSSMQGYCMTFGLPRIGANE